MKKTRKDILSNMQVVEKITVKESIRKKTILTIATLVLSVTIIGCGTKVDNDSTQNITNEVENTADKNSTFIVPTKDRAGNTIVIPSEVNRIISLAPSTTQVLEDLGVGSKLVAVDTQSPMYSTISTDLVQFDLMAPDLEQLLELAPDVVYVSSMTNYSGEDILKVVRDAGIAVVEIPTSDTIEDVKLDIQFIADTLSIPEKGQAIVDTMEEEINKVKAIGETIQDKKSVYFEISAAPYMYSFGNNVYLDEMIQTIGATNVLGEEDGWLSVSGESIIEANPSVILTSVNYIENAVDEIKGRDGYGDLDAVKNNEVYYINNGYASLPNHNIVKALKEMAKAVYPEYYGEIE